MTDHPIEGEPNRAAYWAADKAGKPAIQINYKSETRELVSFAMSLAAP